MKIYEHYLYEHTNNESCSDYDEVLDYEWLKYKILNKFARFRMLYYICTKPDCINNKGIGVYIRQRDEFTKAIWDRNIDFDDVEHEYIDDYLYTIYYDGFNPHLYQKRYTPDWHEQLRKAGVTL
ncbi:hypothetical protein [Lysinibacillus fusiformis]|uniref:hypothetical protein n=1 Tax=Lysinibacillus fusiformis TaxID=28031 RepID=UPI003017E120